MLMRPTSQDCGDYYAHYPQGNIDTSFMGGVPAIQGQGMAAHIQPRIAGFVGHNTGLGYPAGRTSDVYPQGRRVVRARLPDKDVGMQAQNAAWTVGPQGQSGPMYSTGRNYPEEGHNPQAYRSPSISGSQVTRRAPLLMPATMEHAFRVQDASVVSTSDRMQTSRSSSLRPVLAKQTLSPLSIRTQPWSNGENGSNAYADQASQSFSPTYTASSRQGNDEADKKFRTHPLYNVRAEADGRFYCPFASTTDCNHGPTKLKCNYECAFLYACTIPLSLTDCGQQIH